MYRIEIKKKSMALHFHIYPYKLSNAMSMPIQCPKFQVSGAKHFQHVHELVIQLIKLLNLGAQDSNLCFEISA